LKKKTGPPALALNTAAEVNEFTKNSTVAIVGFFKVKENYRMRIILNILPDNNGLYFVL